MWGDAPQITVIPAGYVSPERLAGLDLVFFCTPPEVSAVLVPRALEAGVRAVDLSGAFRLSEDDYPRWYGFVHHRPDVLRQARYSMPEVTGTEGLASARLVSNPGCYATAAALVLLPLLRDGVVEPDGIVVDAKGGTTGAGRRSEEELSFSEIDGDVRAYRVGRHRHTPEIDRALALGGIPGIRVTFTPHLVPLRRGILATAYGRLRPGKTAADAADAVSRFVGQWGFLRAALSEGNMLRGALGTNLAVIYATADPERGMAVGLVAIDNLVKGAAGQAIQNANLMMGWPEHLGLDRLRGMA